MRNVPVPPDQSSELLLSFQRPLAPCNNLLPDLISDCVPSVCSMLSLLFCWLVDGNAVRILLHLRKVDPLDDIKMPLRRRLRAAMKQMQREDRGNGRKEKNLRREILTSLRAGGPS